MAQLERHLLSAEMIDPGSGEVVRTPIDMRVDPLTGHSSRILPDRGLMPASRFDLEAFATREPGHVPVLPGADRALDAEVAPSDRRGRPDRPRAAVLFPNLHAYGSHSSVSVYSPAAHYLPLERISARLMADNLAAQVAYIRAVMASDPDARWASINANHMLPSGSSLFHPHLQGLVERSSHEHAAAAVGGAGSAF